MENYINNYMVNFYMGVSEYYSWKAERSRKELLEESYKLLDVLKQINKGEQKIEERN